MDGDFDGDHWFYPRIGVFRHPGLCPGAAAGRIGMVSGLFFGFAFGMGGLGAAVLGLLRTIPVSIWFIKSVLSCHFWDIDDIPS
jgi:hypothetical protein